MHALTTDADLTAALRASEEAPVLLFKHSRTCPISALANDALTALGPADVEVYRVVVQDARPLSNAIAAALGVRHESPQALLVHHGAVAFHASHYAITAARVREAVRDLTAEDA